MPLDPVIQEILEKLNAMDSEPLSEVTPEEFRRRPIAVPSEPVKVKEIRNIDVSLIGRTLPVRIYIPESLGEPPYPALVFFHGGGWVTGSIASHDPVCRVLANVGQCMVLSVEYRLAPEHKFPAAIHDAYDMVKWVADEAHHFDIDTDRIAVGGDSAGGNLAAVACILAKEKHTPNVAFQLLMYPSTGYDSDSPPPSFRENGEGYLLSIELMKWFRQHYLNSPEELKDPYVSPILYDDLRGLPSAYVATAEYDPLRDVGKAYADKLQENGVDVIYQNFDGLIHGFANFYGASPGATKALETCAEALRKALHS